MEFKISLTNLKEKEFGNSKKSNQITKVSRKLIRTAEFQLALLNKKTFGTGYLK